MREQPWVWGAAGTCTECKKAIVQTDGAVAMLGCAALQGTAEGPEPKSSWLRGGFGGWKGVRMHLMLLSFH